jgi:hypothetical protein
MSDSTEYGVDAVKKWVWSGFCTPADVDEMVDDVLDEDSDEGAIRATIAPEFARKRAAEAGWPSETDCDRLDAAFVELNASGIIALHNTGYTMSDGRDIVGIELEKRDREAVVGYCYYHAQDVERALECGGLWIAFGDLDNTPEGKVAVGRRVVAELERHGFHAAWDGDPERRIGVPEFDWKRRGPT